MTRKRKRCGKPTRVLLAGLVAFMTAAGCLVNPNLGEWPPRPTVPAGAQEPDRPGLCRITNIDATPTYGEYVTLDVSSRFARDYSAAWKETELESWARSPGEGEETLLALAVVLNETTSPRLGYVFDHPSDDQEGRSDFDDAIVSGPEYGHWYPWEVGGQTHSNERALDGWGLMEGNRTVTRGWVLAYRGADLWFSLADGTLVKNVHGLKLTLAGGGSVFVGRSIECA